MPGLETQPLGVAAARVVERRQPVDIGVGYRTADTRGARASTESICAHPRCVGVVTKGVHVRMRRRLGVSPAPPPAYGPPIATFSTAASPSSISSIASGYDDLARLQDAFRHGARLVDERHADEPRSGLGREARLEIGVGIVCVFLPRRIAENRAGEARRRRRAVVLAADHELRDPDAVQPNFETMRPAEAADVVVEVRLELDLDGVLAIHRKGVPHGDAAARTERKVLAEPRVLDQQPRDVVGLDRRAGQRPAQRLTRDFLRGRHVPIQERRRNRQHVGDVVEPVLIGIVGGKQRADVDLDAEEIADGVGVLRAVQAMHRRTAGIRRSRPPRGRGPIPVR